MSHDEPATVPAQLPSGHILTVPAAELAALFAADDRMMLIHTGPDPAGFAWSDEDAPAWREVLAIHVDADGYVCASFCADSRSWSVDEAQTGVPDETLHVILVGPDELS